MGKDCVHVFIFTPCVSVIQHLVSSIVQIDSFQHIISYESPSFVLWLSTLIQKIGYMIFAIMRNVPLAPLSIYCNTNQKLCILLPREDPPLVVFDKNSVVIFVWLISVHTLPPQNEVAYCVVGSAVVLDSWWGLREGRRENGLGELALGPTADLHVFYSCMRREKVLILQDGNSNIYIY